MIPEDTAFLLPSNGLYKCGHDGHGWVTVFQNHQTENPHLLVRITTAFAHSTILPSAFTPKSKNPSTPESLQTNTKKTTLAAMYFTKAFLLSAAALSTLVSAMPLDDGAAQADVVERDVYTLGSAGPAGDLSIAARGKAPKKQHSEPSQHSPSCKRGIEGRCIFALTCPGNGRAPLSTQLEGGSGNAVPCPDRVKCNLIGQVVRIAPVVPAVEVQACKDFGCRC